MSTPLLAVRLDDPNYGAGPGTVIAIPRTIAEYEALVRGPDGARDPSLRLWKGTAQIGEKVSMSTSTPQGVTWKKGAMTAKKPTFAAARAAIQAALRAAGWTLSPSLNPQGRPYKIPYATSPDGVVRLWFKTEAVYAAVNTSDIGEAHSACSDMRELDPVRFAETIYEDVVRWHVAMRDK